MIPVLIGIGVALFGLGALKFKKVLYEKKFVVLGTRQVGKTVLLNFLRSGKINTEKYARTTEQKIKSGKIELADYKLDVATTTDISGSEDYRMRWESLIKNADYVCYIIRGDKIYNGDYEYTELVKDHVIFIKNIIEKNGKNKKIYLMVSYCDNIGDYNDESKEELFETKLRFKLGQIIVPNSETMFGSLVNQEEAEKFVIKLLGKILNK